MEEFNLLVEVRWHGRAGQGVVTVSRLLAYGALLDGKHVQAFPEFGPERLGAPVSGFTRISDEPIETHSQVYNPNVVAVLDPTLLDILNVEDGIVERGQILVNTRENHQDVRRRFGRDDVATYTVDATGIALSILGRPVSNTAMLGALVRVAPYVSLESTLRATAERFPGPLAEKNEQVIRRAYEEVKGY